MLDEGRATVSFAKSTRWRPRPRRGTPPLAGRLALGVAAHAAAILLVGFAATRLSQAALAGSAFVTFEDPLEQAFRLETPSGWSARGGMFRLGMSDFRPMIVLTSADGQISIRSGDVAVPVAYALPNSFHARDGDVEDLGAQAQLIHAHYRTGKEFARLYALARFGSLCRRLTPQASDWTPPMGAGNTAAQGSAGSLTYQCDSKAGGTRIVYVYAMTAHTESTLWQVSPLISFMAPPEQVTLAHAVIEHGTKTFKLSQSWVAQQHKRDADALVYQRARQEQRFQELGEQVAQFESRMRAMQNHVAAFQHGQAARSDDFKAFDNAINGITSTIDPLGGRMRDVFTGPKSEYWENGLGTVVNSNGSPGAGFHQLNLH